MDTALSKIQCLNGTVLKVIALVSMTIDHVGYILLPQFTWMRILGRLAFPIFAYMIAEGCFYTKNKKRYLFMVAAIGVLCQAAMVIARGSWHLNILFTFAFSILLIFLLQWALGRKEVFVLKGAEGTETEMPQSPVGSVPTAVRWALFVFVLAVCVFLDYGMRGIVRGFQIDYGVIGILLAVVIYVVPGRYQKLLAIEIWLCILVLCRQWQIQWWSLLAVIPLFFYNGKPGKHRGKYFFYLYYPIHLGILWGIYFLLHAGG